MVASAARWRGTALHEEVAALDFKLQGPFWPDRHRKITTPRVGYEPVIWRIVFSPVRPDENAVDVFEVHEAGPVGDCRAPRRSAVFPRLRARASVLDCASPLGALAGHDASARHRRHAGTGLHSAPMPHPQNPRHPTRPTTSSVRSPAGG